MAQESVTLHNVAATQRADDGGVRLQRVPESVRTALNETARERMLEPSGVEIRFIADSRRVEVTLSCPTGSATVHPYWGPFRGSDTVTVDGGPRTVELQYPESLEALDTDVAADFAFDPGVWRLLISGDPVSFHGVEGEGIRPPEPTALPERRYLAYGTSITQGAAATGPHLTYVFQTARQIGADAMNLGTSGSAYCESDIADYIAGRDDWDVATLALSVNMYSAGFSIETFRERVSYMVSTIAETGRPVVCITLFPVPEDVPNVPAHPDARANTAAFRGALREVVETISAPNVHLLEGPDLLSNVGGLSPDLTHPSDHGMIEIANRLAMELETHL